MEVPSREICYRALETRDPRFDGLMFMGVTSTGIYCRPVCPARTPKFEYCRFFGSAAAAQEAGFRPCLRCRPETAPDLASWRGSSNTVSRACGHRRASRKLRSILPYVLGAVSGESLAQWHELQRLQRELRRKKADFRNLQTLSERWRATIDARVSEAKDMGLIASDAPAPVDQSAAMEKLRAIATTINAVPLVTAAAVNEGMTELNRLNAEEQSVAQELSRLRRRSAEMEQLRQSSTSYQSSVVLQRDRLQLSRWLSDHHAKQDCPLCNTHLVEPPAKLGELLISLNGLEEAAAANALPPSFDRELERVAAALSKQVERLKGIRIRQGALTKQSQAARDRQHAQLRASRFLGHLEAELPRRAHRSGQCCRARSDR
jgi:methylphosphotriester-DNA--protein-cysteine methyltransferase